jgi:hypothetical protein
MKRLLVFVFFLAACGGAPALTGADVAAKLPPAATDVKATPLTEGAPVPRSFTEHWSFTLAPVAPRGGQFFVCDTKKNCDAIYAYFDALKGLAGPYLYQSPSGTIVMQLNSGLTPDQASSFEAAVKALP